MLNGFSINPSVIKVRGGAWRGDFQEFCNLFEQDLPSLHSLKAEMDLWERKW